MYILLCLQLNIFTLFFLDASQFYLVDLSETLIFAFSVCTWHSGTPNHKKVSNKLQQN